MDSRPIGVFDSGIGGLTIGRGPKLGWRVEELNRSKLNVSDGYEVIVIVLN